MKRKRLIWGIAVTLLVLFVVASLSINSYAEWRLRKEIAHFSTQKGKGLYALTVGDTYVNVWKGEVEVSDLLITTDTAKWAAIRQTWPDSFPPVIDLSIDSINILNFGIIRYLSSHTADITSIVLNKPVLTILQRRDTTVVQRDSTRAFRLSALPELIAPIADSLKIGQVSILHADMFFSTLQQSDTLKQDVSDLNLSFNDVAISKSAAAVTYCRDIQLDIGHLENRQAGKRSIAIDSFSLSKARRQISLRNFSVTPLQSEAAFFSQLRFRKAYFAFTCAEIVLEGFDLDRLVKSSYFSADSLLVSQANMDLTVNKSLPLPYRKILPNEAAREMAAQFNVKNVIIKDSNIGIKTKVPEAEYVVSFNHVYATGNNLSNDSTLMDLQHPFEIQVESKFMNRSPLKLSMSVPLLSPTLAVDYNATMQYFPLTALNPVIQHNNVIIKNGYMQKVEIRSSVRDGIAGGTVRIQYKNLELEFQRKDTRKPRKVLSKIAEIFVKENKVEEEEDDATIPFKTGVINHVRNRQEEFFAFLWHSIQTGLIPPIVPVYDKLNLKPKQ